MKVLGLGNALVDVLSQLESDDTLQLIGIQKGAMDMITEEQMGLIRKHQEGKQTTVTPGGANCNTMRAIALLGGTSGFIGKVGDDELARFYEQEICASGAASWLIRSHGPSGSCTVFISPDGERTMGTFLGPAPTIRPEEITDELLRAYYILYIEGYLIVNEPLVRETMARAKRLGLRVALDLCNASEAEAFTGEEPHAAIRSLTKQVDTAIVTLGKEGALVGHQAEVFQVEAEGGKPLDTTGAGDNFAAGFLYGLSVGATREQAARIGSCLSGEVIRVIGPQIPAERWEQIKLKVKSILA